LFEIHRFQQAVQELVGGGEESEGAPVDCLDPISRDAMTARCSWVVNNPDIVVTLHAIRVELLLHYVMRNIVPPDEENPFQYWLRFEFGQSGNPHGHGLAYVAGNPEFDLIVKDAHALEEMLKQAHPHVADMRTWEQAEQEIAEFYSPYVNETHPCKDSAGQPLWNYHKSLYELEIENIRMPECAKPQTINLLALLEEVFADDAQEPDLSKLQHLLLALIENGQRHDGPKGHGHKPPKLGAHPCAREDKRKNEVYCRYLFPRELRQFPDDTKGCVVDDPHRPDLRNLFLSRNDSLLNNFEDHLLLGNLGNIDWRALLNLWSVLEYLTKYTAKGGKGSQHLGKLFEDVLSKVMQYEMEDGIHDMWRRTIMKFYSQILGGRDYSLFEVAHFGVRLPGVLSSFGDVHSASVSNWAGLKKGMPLARTAASERVTHHSALEKFNLRCTLRLPKSMAMDELENISFYSFSRLYDVANGCVVRKQRKKLCLFQATVGLRKRTCRTVSMRNMQEKHYMRTCLALAETERSTLMQWCVHITKRPMRRRCETLCMMLGICGVPVGYKEIIKSRIRRRPTLLPR
jgi:hypothetical protein